jgi:hypothetical protein
MLQAFGTLRSERMTIETDHGLFERGAELRTIVAAAGEARDGRGQLVLIEGQAGIGKTTLLGELHRAATEAAFAVLTATGGDLEREFAWGVVRQLFEPLVHGEAGADLVRGAAALAGPVLGVGGAPPPVSHGDAGFAAQHGLYWVAANVAETRPVAIVVDDAHWADAASLQFLTYLGRRLADIPVLVGLAMRPTEPDATDRMMQGLRSLPATQLVAPPPLSEVSVAALVERQRGRRPGPLLLEACHAVTGGNPFLLEELLRALGDAADADDAVAAAHVHEVGPLPVAHAVLGRLAVMWPDALCQVNRGKFVGFLKSEDWERHRAELHSIERDDPKLWELLCDLTRRSPTFSAAARRAARLPAGCKTFASASKDSAGSRPPGRRAAARMAA